MRRRKARGIETLSKGKPVKFYNEHTVTVDVLKPDTPFANSWTVGDLTRELTPKGEEQAADARRGWFGALDVRAVICSEATRAIATKESVDSFEMSAPRSVRAESQIFRVCVKEPRGGGVYNRGKGFLGGIYRQGKA